MHHYHPSDLPWCYVPSLSKAPHMLYTSNAIQERARRLYGGLPGQAPYHHPLKSPSTLTTPSYAFTAARGLEHSLVKRMTLSAQCPLFEYGIYSHHYGYDGDLPLMAPHWVFTINIAWRMPPVTLQMQHSTSHAPHD